MNFPSGQQATHSLTFIVTAAALLSSAPEPFNGLGDWMTCTMARSGSSAEASASSVEFLPPSSLGSAAFKFDYVDKLGASRLLLRRPADFCRQAIRG